MKSQYLKDFIKKDMPVDSLFAVKEKKNVRPYLIDKSKYMFSLKISDKTGDMILNYFGDKDEQAVVNIFKKINTQEVVHIKGITNEYQGQINVIVNPDTESIKKAEKFDLSDFLPMTKKDISEMVLEFKKIISEIENVDIKRLLESVFNNNDFMDKYSQSPAASFNHHSFGGGLIEHVLSMIKIAKCVVEMHPELNKDLLIAGCIFHDIGKVKELNASISIEYTDEGHLLGHISIGQKMVTDWIDGVTNFPEVLKNKILHMILSHHGKKELGSPVTPLFPEAHALHHIDHLDSTIQDELQKKERDGKDEKWIRNYNGWPTMYLE